MDELTTVKRLHYFDHQFLRADDFTAEQRYHLTMRRLHNQLLHSWGIASGLDVTFKGGATSVTVASGVALDSLGREIVIPSDKTVELQSFPADTSLFLAVAYFEEPTDQVNEAGTTGNTRYTEEPKEISVLQKAPGDPSTQIVLGRVQRTGTEVTGVDTSMRRAAGTAGGSLDVLGLGFRDPNIASSGWARMRLEAANRALLQGSLHISDSLDLDKDATVKGALTATGALAAKGGLTVTGAATVSGDASVGGSLTLTGTGNVTLRRALVVLGTTDGANAKQGEVVGALGFRGNSIQHGQLAFRAGAGFELVDVSALMPQIGYAAGSFPFADLRVRNLTWSAGSLLLDDQGGSIELGGNPNAAGVGTPYVDFHFNGKKQDFNVRLINDVDGQLTAVGNFRVSGLLSIGALPPNPPRNPYFTAGELHVGGGAAGYSFTNRQTGATDEDTAFDNVAGNRWVLYSSEKIARLYTGLVGDRLQLNTNGDLWIAGTSNIFRVWQTVVAIRNASVDNAGSVNVNFGVGFAQVYAVIPVVTGISIFGVTAADYARGGLHAPDVRAIPQHVWARVTAFSNTSATIQGYCSESEAGNEVDNTLIVTVVVLGKGA